MKAYVTSIGEKTTDICCKQLEKYGFEVVLLDKEEPWIDKYQWFIGSAQPPCIRVDADVIVNANIKCVHKLSKDNLMVQFRAYDLYQNNLSTSVVYYTEDVIDAIAADFNKIDSRRPEATAWRLDNVVKKTVTSDTVIGMHGFFQDNETIERAKKNKEDRGQLDNYDFELVRRLNES